MNRKKADELYKENWCGQDLDLEQTLQRIQAVAEAGGYQTHIQFNSSGSRQWIAKELKERGFYVEAYNGTMDIIGITWG